MLALIGGTGLYQLPGLEIHKTHEVKTPFGLPSGAIQQGQLHGSQVLFLARHGETHQLLPHEINYAANIYALKVIGARSVLSVSAVGSLKEEKRPGDLVLIDQYLDFTKGFRRHTYFGSGVTAHIQTAYPIAKLFHQALVQVAQSIQLKERLIHPSGTYVCVEGPRLGTRAESHMFQKMGADIVGMTNIPEAFLAREAQLAYASVGVVTDYDSWKDDPAEHALLSDIFALYKSSLADVVRFVSEIVKVYPSFDVDSYPERMSLEAAIMTPEGAISKDIQEWLHVLKI